MSHLSIRNVSKYFGGRDRVAALTGVSLEIESGEMLVLLGPSGCGKTTLLRMIAGLEEPSGGRIEIGGRAVVDTETGVAVPLHRRDIGLVFQNYALWPHMTVLDNVAFPLKARGIETHEAHRRAHKVLELVGCGLLGERFPAQLSGGQQQRVALSRSLSAEPKTVLFDEPLSNVDAQLRRVLRAEIRRIHDEVRFTGVYVTHDQREGLELGDRIAVMRGGTIEQIGTPSEIHDRPATAYVASFLGIGNRTVCRREGGLVRTSVGESAGAWDKLILPTHQCAEVFVRSEEMHLGPAGSDHGPNRCVLRGGILVDSIYAGSATEYVVRVGDQTFFSTLPKEQAVFTKGQIVDCSFAPDHAFAYPLDQASGRPES
jgi:iron(III) transport system ATP-binding protein